jgi:phosphoribosylformylglycinamidine cyclo-ligase
MTTYSDAGVDIDRGEEAVRRLKKHVEKTYSDDVLGGIGWFSGVINVKSLKNFTEPVLSFTIDGVGTKTIIAAMLGRWKGIGHDIVNHCANDLVCQGGTPLAFLDYLASSTLDPAIVEEIVSGMSEACQTLDCVLIGGETAEMPKVYHKGATDVAGAMVGVAERSKMITGEKIRAGDLLVALPSSGLHTNGYSLARKVLLEDAKMDLGTKLEDTGITLGEALLAPHTEYSRLVRKLHDAVGINGVAHITGGGIPGNLPRILPKGLGAQVKRSAIGVLPLFTLMQEKGNVPQEDMESAMNMGVGMILVIHPSKLEGVLREAKAAYVIGEVCKGEAVVIA